ncbi:MAG TPA: serine hydrolase [Thermomicrobiales bacterium]|nr:serine hydrolase [Thermomicrobiales bacterium]
MTETPPTAAALGLMDGYPAPPDKRVTRENLMQPPYNRWGFQHMRELMPTAEVYRGPGPVRELPRRPLDLSDLQFVAADGSQRTVKEMLDLSYADAFVVLHNGALVYEQYPNGMGPASQHLMMSVTKSLVGTLALQLAHEGTIDPSRMVADYLPELTGSAWEDASVQNALDMTTGIRFDEVYDFADGALGDLARFAIATGFSAMPEGYDGPRTVPELLPQFPKAGNHGEAFHYVTPNTDVIGWIIARVTGQPFSRIFGERIWSRLGAERDAYMIRDAIGMQMAGAGFNATARDLARFGQLLLDDGVCDGQQLIAPEVIAVVRDGGDREAFARGTEEYGPLWQGWSYRAFWWVTHNSHGAFTGIGINGQWLYIDPTARVVIVQQSSYPTSDQPEADDVCLPGFHAIAQHLMDRQ